MAQTVAIGVDTHKDTHVAVALGALGGELGHCSIAATRAGYAELLVWAQRFGEPVFAIEGCGSYGSGLVRFLTAAGVFVREAERPRRRDRVRGKNDLIDARIAARRVLSGDGLSTPRCGGQREHLRMLLAERRSAVQARTVAINQLHSLVVTLPAELREQLSGLSSVMLVKTLARRPASDEIGAVLRRIAQRAESLQREISEIFSSLGRIVRELAPELLAQCGVGIICAAQLVVSSGDAKRMRSDAAFAALAGTSPVDASSGKQQRHRLNRGGDRQLNRALHTVILHRRQHDPATRDYIARRVAEGKSTRDATRILKRYLARHLYRVMQNASPTMT